MADVLDPVALYGRQVLGAELCPRTVLVEGTTDAELFHLAVRLERKRTGIDLFGRDLAIVAAGVGNEGGTRGVIRELICLRGLARACVLPNGRPRYRFVALFDNDKAGRLAIKGARDIDTSILEYKDLFRLFPVMPTTGNLDPGTLQKSFERLNADYKGIDWELEDLMPEFVEAFIPDCPGAVVNTTAMNGKIHRDLTRDGKARLHQFVRDHAERDDLEAIIDVLRAIRFYLGLPSLAN